MTHESFSLKDQHEAHKQRLRRLSPAPVLSIITQTAPPPEPEPEPDSLLQAEALLVPPRPEPEPWVATIPPPGYNKVTIIRHVCAHHFGCAPSDILSSRRTDDHVYRRYIVMFFADAANKSLADIGDRLGGRDHSTVFHGIKVIAAAVKTDWKVAFDVAHIELKLANLAQR